MTLPSHRQGMFTTRRKVAIGVATLSVASLVTAIVLRHLGQRQEE